LLGDSAFNKELWGAEHLIMGDDCMGDDCMGDDGRERHAVRDRLKKLTANIENGSCPSWIIGTNGIW
jgi:hypothetical protein